jgi:outer membrane protein OmpA-like peptidoglycan-associated protein
MPNYSMRNDSMQFRHGVIAALSFAFLLTAVPLAFADNAPAPAPDAQAVPAPNLPQACVDAGVTTEADCKALLQQQKRDARKAAADKAAADKAAADKAAADQAAGDKAAQDKAAQDRAAADQAASEKAAADKAAADQAAAEKAAVRQKAAEEKAAAAAAKADAAAAAKAEADKAAADKAAADKAAADKAAADKAAAEKAAAEKAAADAAAAAPAPAAAPAAEAAPAAAVDSAKPQNKPRLHLPKDCIAAGAKTTEDCDALHAAAATKTEAPAPVAEPAPAAAAAAPAAETAPAAAAADTNAPAAETGKPKRLAKDCVAAGVTTAEDCDALHAIAGQKGKGTPPATEQAPAAAPAAVAPAAAPADQTPPPAPTPSASDLPSVVSPAKPQAEKPPAPPPAPAPADLSAKLNAAAKGYNSAVAGLSSSDPAAVDKAKKSLGGAQARLDAICKTQFDSTAQCLAQYGISLDPLPAEAGVQPVVAAPVQPVEVINNLPKGVTQSDVAPLLDSVKDATDGKGGKPPAAAALPTTPPPPAPTNDASAQSGLKFKPGKFKPIDQSQGQQIDPNAPPPQVMVPQNVTIVNNTTTNVTNTNTVTNTVTNNTQNNNGPGNQQNGQQGNGPGRGGPGQGQPNPIGLGLQVILQVGNDLIINSPAQDQRRIANQSQDDTTYDRLPGGRYRETISRPDGTRVVTIYNQNGDILRRSRFDRPGHEVVLAYFDDSYDQDLQTWRDPGEDLPPLRLRIPARDYVLDADNADESEVQTFFAQPPVEQVQRLYSIDEVKRSARIRDMVRRLEIGDLTFDTGAATISQDQIGNLSKVAKAMLALLKKNPAETFLIEGHTDAVGSDISNLKLSDARAATVAEILSDFYHIPPENLATQGYGERFLKVQTDGPEMLNRRVTIRRITSLVTIANQR